VLRIYRLPVALELPMLADYGGCKSWVQVAHPIQAVGSMPVIGETEFNQKVEQFRASLNRNAVEHGVGEPPGLPRSASPTEPNVPSTH
jgi:hypothetical protein